jgi:hypothetical protein
VLGNFSCHARIGIAGENHEVGLVGLHERPSSLKKKPVREKKFGRGEGFEPSHAGIKIRCLNQLGDSPTQVNCKNNQP